MRSFCTCNCKYSFVRTVLILPLLLILNISAFALPGIKYYLPDSSGEYVYYTDNTFTTPSIIGFLYYDDTNYAIRYYAPANFDQKIPEKDITIYITIDSEDPGVVLTGEKIVGASDNEDIDIINYMHDLLYQLSKVRSQVSLTDSNETVETKHIADFGGDVKVTFNSIIPIFNVYSINTVDNKNLLTVNTVGLLTSSQDNSFTTYKRVDGLPKDLNRNFTIDKRASKNPTEYQNQKITLDSMWQQSFADNIWLLGDEALLTINEITVPKTYENYKDFYFDMIIRKLSQSTALSYSLWSHRQYKADKNKVTINNIFYQTDTGNVTRDFKIITKVEDGKYAYMTLTVFDSTYQQNKKYFDNILSSYKVNY